ncbi:hypothetical protein Srufu_033680 [Streptomyces libani subsp. rufus]|nr:hypothetical protein Srufu_033680 [Streptomyces libani subsp. rufus]
MDRPRSLAHPHVRLATMAAVLCAMVLGLLGSPLATPAAHAANDCTKPLECVRLTPGTDPGRLNLFEMSRTRHSAWMTAESGSGPIRQSP